MKESKLKTRFSFNRIKATRGYIFNIFDAVLLTVRNVFEQGLKSAYVYKNVKVKTSLIGKTTP